MAVRTGFAGTTSPGDVLTSAQITRLPGGWIGYVEVTANQTGIGTGPTDLTSLTLTVTAGTSRRLQITGYCRVTQAAGAAAAGSVFIRNSVPNTLQTSTLSLDASYTGMHAPMSVQTPSAGSNTYKLSAGTTANTFDLIASSSQPAFIMVEDIGPSA
jgi:hypothetical protein